MHILNNSIWQCAQFHRCIQYLHSLVGIIHDDGDQTFICSPPMRTPLISNNTYRLTDYGNIKFI